MDTKLVKDVKVLRKGSYFLIFWLLLLTGFTGSGLAENPESPPSYTCKRATGPIKIDGILNERAWQKAEYAGFKTFDNQMVPGRMSTRAKLLWDDEYLYLCFQCLDENISATMKNRDDDLYKEDVVEVFIDADNDRLTYIEIEINPLGTILDIDVLSDGIRTIKSPSRQWTCQGLRVGVKMNGTIENQKDRDRYWAVETAIPFASLPDCKNLPPREGDTFGITLVRYQREEEKFYHLTWSPCFTPGWPHVPERFGKLIFTNEK